MKTTTLKKRIFIILRGYKIISFIQPPFLPLQTLHSIISGILPFINLYLSARILNQLTYTISIERLTLYITLILGINFILAIISSSINKRLKVMETLRRRKYFAFLAEHYMRLEYEQTENADTNRTLADIESKTSSTGAGVIDLAHKYGQLIQNITSIFTGCILLVSIFSSKGLLAANAINDIYTSLALIVLVIVSVIFIFSRQKYVQGAINRLNTEAPKINSLFEFYSSYVQVKQAAKDIRIFNQQQLIEEIMKKRNNAEQWYKFSHVYGRESGITELSISIVYSVAFILMGLRALEGYYDIGSVLACVGAMRNLSGNVSGLITALTKINNNVAFLPKVFKYIELPKMISKNDLGIDIKEHVIELHNVSFMYPTSKEYAIKNISLKITKGQKLAVVGQNGSGKTTMIKLLYRLYKPTEGKITLDGIDIQQYSYNEYLSLISVVFQDFQLFGFSIGQNISSDIDYDCSKVALCLEKVNYSMPHTLKSGFDTPLYNEYDKNGVTFSGGEAQKVAIARALYKKTSFLILDEPTASLDPESEFEIYSQINTISAGKGVVFISHRLSVCRFCDNIAVFHEGRIVQYGNHNDLLLSREGKYYELWTSQAQYYVDMQ